MNKHSIAVVFNRCWPTWPRDHHPDYKSNLGTTTITVVTENIGTIAHKDPTTQLKLAKVFGLRNPVCRKKDLYPRGSQPVGRDPWHITWGVPRWQWSDHLIKTGETLVKLSSYIRNMGEKGENSQSTSSCELVDLLFWPYLNTQNVICQLNSYNSKSSQGGGSKV